MALIGTIRKNSWVLIALMALALGGFILMDIVSNSSRNSMADLNTMGKVNGTTITRDQFDNYEKIIYGNAQGDPYQRRQTMWNYFVEKALVEKEAEELGLGVGKEELRDLQFGANPSPVLAQRQLTPEILARVQQMIDQNQFPDPQTRIYWAEQEKEIIKDRVQSKLLNMVSKAVYAPTWQAEMAFRENNERVDFTYVRVPFDKVTDDEAKVSDSDFADFLKENGKMYYQAEETRIVNYVAIDVVPTAQDSANAREAVSKLAEGLRTATNDSAFVASNQGTLENSYKKKETLPAAVADALTTQPLGSVVGPYLDGDNWCIAKIIDRKAVPDSVKARHILRQASDPTAEKTIDSLKNLVETGKARFDSLAAKFGTDGTMTKGGDLGWFAQGQMVAEFNDLCFNKADQGKVYKVATQFGWHLVEVTGKKFLNNSQGVKMAVISQRVIPGKTTEQAAKDKAVALSTQAKNSNDLEAKAKEYGLTMQASSPIRANDFYFGALGQGNTAREMVRWTFEETTKKDAVSKEIFTFGDPAGGYFDSKYVVAAVKSISPKGMPTVEGVRAQIETLVKNRKKGQVLASKIQNAGDISAVASQFGVKIDSALGASIMAPSIASVGNEPKVVGKVFSMKNGETSKPIIGNNGVYVAKAIMDKPTGQLPPDLTLFRKQVASSTKNNVQQRLMTILKKNADMVDNRSRFF